MDFSTPVYAYTFANAVVSGPDLFDLSIVVATVIAIALAVLAGPYAYGYSVYRRKEREKAEKKRTIQNLLIMKDIQSELEEEMKRALTNANVQQ